MRRRKPGKRSSSSGSSKVNAESERSDMADDKAVRSRPSAGTPREGGRPSTGDHGPEAQGGSGQSSKGGSGGKPSSSAPTGCAKGTSEAQPGVADCSAGRPAAGGADG